MSYRILLFSALTIGIVACGNKISSVKRVTTKPNIIFILADDLGFGDVGAFGQQKIRTPQIDRMAAGGMRFTQFYSGTSVCAPSRSSFMTGQHTGHTPIRGNKAVEPEGQWPLQADAVTVAEVMKMAGYVNGVFGKWGLGYIGTEGDPLNQGFDQFFGYNCQSKAHDFFPDHLWDNDQRLMLNNSFTSQNEYSADIIHQRALQFLEANRKIPFFLCLTYTLPHAGLQLAKGDTLLEYYKTTFQEKPRKVPLEWNGAGYQPQAYPRAAYAAMVGKLDAYVGQVLNKLKELDLEKNTIVIFASDNGPHREGGNDPDFFNSSAGLRGIKRDLYEGGIRTPMIAYWPGQVKAGATSTYIGAFWDLLPTFASLGGGKSPETIDGISLVPTLLNKGGQPKHQYLYWEFHENGGRQAIRMGMWKAVKLQVIENPNSPIELYNLEKDPAEKNNVAKKNPAIVEKMEKLLKEAHVENHDFPFLGSN